MKKMLSIFVLLLFCMHGAYAGYIQIINETPYTYRGTLAASNNTLSPTSGDTYYSYVTISGNSSLYYVNPMMMISPNGPGIPPLPTGIFIGLKGNVTAFPLLDGSVGKPGSWLGFPVMHNYSPNYIIVWEPLSGDNVRVRIIL